jgi:hypothetical protein
MRRTRPNHDSRDENIEGAWAVDSLVGYLAPDSFCQLSRSVCNSKCWERYLHFGMRRRP